MRALFIIHCQDPIYGASRSVSALIRNLDADVDIIFPVKIKQEGRITQEQIRKYYGERVQNVWYLPQPSRLSVTTDPVTFIDHIKCIVKETMFFFCKPKYHQLFKQMQYDFIHLNSVILYPMLCKKYPMFIHVREIVRPKKMFCDCQFTSCMEKAHGILFIGPSGKNACPGINAPQKILANPFDQRDVQLVDYKDACKQFDLQGTETVYSILGNVIPEKGVLFVVKAFQKAKMENAVLLIAGQDTHHRDYEKEILKIASSDPRIRCIGEIENTAPLYRVTDYVVRGDDQPGCGRTTYEGLYSGCGAIVQYRTANDREIPDLTEEMKRKIEFYKLRSEEDLIRAFKNTQFRKIEQRQYYGNTAQYVESFLNFVDMYS